eukprot:7333453-Pyramimonas_sp.AAC.1
MARQACSEKSQALLTDLRRNHRKYSNWLATAFKTPATLHKITKPPPRREHEVAHQGKVLSGPLDIVDAKAADFNDIWACHDVPHSHHTTLLSDLRQ